MRLIQTIKEVKEDMGNNENRVKKGVYLTDENEYFYLTSTQGGTVKKLKRALRKAGFNE